jgi:hypothetical protein
MSALIRHGEGERQEGLEEAGREGDEPRLEPVLVYQYCLKGRMERSKKWVRMTEEAGC